MHRLRFSLAFLLAVGALVVAVEPTLAGTRHQAVVPTTTVNVVMTDFAFALSKKVVPHGTVIFKLMNKGGTPHDFFVYKVNKKSALISPGKTGVLKVTFTKAGTYHYICTVGEHAFHGMQGDLRVK